MLWLTLPYYLHHYYILSFFHQRPGEDKTMFKWIMHFTIWLIGPRPSTTTLAPVVRWSPLLFGWNIADKRKTLGNQLSMTSSREENFQVCTQIHTFHPKIISPFDLRDHLQFSVSLPYRCYIQNLVKIGKTMLKKILTQDGRQRTPNYSNMSPEWLRWPKK